MVVPRSWSDVLFTSPGRYELVIWGLAADTQYQIAVAAHNEAGRGPHATIRAVTPIAAHAEPQPEDPGSGPGSGNGGVSSARFVAVSAGSSHSCGLRTDGSVTCWGHNVWGQASVPVGEFVAVSAGSSHSCGLRTGGSVICWGDNSLGQAGASGGSFVEVSAGFSHSCGVRTDRSAVCWGRSSSWQVVAPEGQFRTVSVGHSHACGVRTDGSVACWGDPNSRVLQPLGGEFRSVSTGNSKSCGVRTDGSVACWGDFSTPGLPTAVSFTDVSVGRRLSCGLLTDGSVACWGDTGDPPSGLFTAVSAGDSHACGVRTDGSVVCWGDNTWGQADAPSLPANAGVHQPAIDALEENHPGLFHGTGCGHNGLCPDEPLQRWEMAVWMVRILDRQSPTDRPAQRFDDVPDDKWWASHADRLAELKVTIGCSTQPFRFCPDQPQSPSSDRPRHRHGPQQDVLTDHPP